MIIKKKTKVFQLNEYFINSTKSLMNLKAIQSIQKKQNFIQFEF